MDRLQEPSGRKMSMEPQALRTNQKLNGFRNLVYLSLLLHVLMVFLLIAAFSVLTYKFNGISQLIPTTLEEVPEHGGISKRSTSAPLVLGMLQQKLPGLEIEAIKLVGTKPLLQVDQNGTIGPWHFEEHTVDWAAPGEDGTSVNILATGMYYVYAQMYYLTKESANSYEVIRWKGGNTMEGEKNRQLLTACANQAVIAKTRVTAGAEVSCHTGVVATLQPGDSLSINQIERYRVLIFSPGFSHWGIIRMRTNK